MYERERERVSESTCSTEISKYTACARITKKLRLLKNLKHNLLEGGRGGEVKREEESSTGRITTNKADWIMY